MTLEATRYYGSTRRDCSCAGRKSELKIENGADRSVRGDQRQRGESRRRIRHEHPAPGFAFLGAVFAIKVERMGAPCQPIVLINLNLALIGPEPLQALAHNWIADRNSCLPERVHDQPGRI